MSQDTKITLVMIGVAAGLVITMLLAANSYGQTSMTSEETDRLSALYTEMATYGYTEVRDLDAQGNEVEFRSNGTIPIEEDTAAEMIQKYGFEMQTFAPAPALQEDSIIIISTMNRTGLVL